MTDEVTFWMVWNPARQAPTHRHEHRTDAIREAERLARLHPGQQFYVLEAVEMREVAEPMRRVTLDEPLPF